ncbi:MAG: hypothetical protein ONB30_01500 [candidate division KSB1 bacterium]|nr:hypothetical protein [candidate division KSB1 bacterium]
MQDKPIWSALLAAVLGCSLLAGGELRGQSGAHDPEFIVSGGSWPGVAGLAEGGFVICWQAQRADPVALEGL